MSTLLPRYFRLSSEVVQARESNAPLVALESTVITHGLPFPENQDLARDMETEVRREGALPATIALLDGLVQVGLSEEQLERLARETDLRKVSPRDLARLIIKQESGGTTVAGTIFLAEKTGIKVFATGGIGGVHRQAGMDISADLPQLATTPIIVVCAGAKAILDLPATLEYLETSSVPVIGYQTDEFPAFYSRSSGLPVSVRLDTPQEVEKFAQAHWEMEMRSAVLVTVPPPLEVALTNDEIEGAINQALEEASITDIHGQAVTPYLLKRVNELSGGASLRSNLGLLRNNARIAAQIAGCLSQNSRWLSA
jgi:pseudouridine-5'-phosphate glycosidase